MGRISNCVACNNKKNGVKTRISVPHTCGLSIPGGTADNMPPLTGYTDQQYQDQMKVIRAICTAQTQTSNREHSEIHTPRTPQH